jgi:Rab GDP dissociation inhibitor
MYTISSPKLYGIQAIQLYGKSVGRYGQNSPYLYPQYGLSTLPEGFSRLAAIYGGTVMLRSDAPEILKDEAGHVQGVKVGKSAAKARFVIGDASYFAPDQSVLVKKVARR